MTPTLKCNIWNKWFIHFLSVHNIFFTLHYKKKKRNIQKRFFFVPCLGFHVFRAFSRNYAAFIKFCIVTTRWREEVRFHQLHNTHPWQCCSSPGHETIIIALKIIYFLWVGFLCRRAEWTAERSTDSSLRGRWFGRRPEDKTIWFWM